ncbi:MAG: hypothetical protein ABIS30_00590 [Gallionella sp.]|jgi:hypothetical protein
MRIEGELAVLNERIMARKANFKIRSLALVVDDRGYRLTYGQLRSHSTAPVKPQASPKPLSNSAICAPKRPQAKPNQAEIFARRRSNSVTPPLV